MNNAMSHIYGFRLKDSVVKALKAKYTNKPLIIPGQICKHDYFAQRASATGLKQYKYYINKLYNNGIIIPSN